ncbi:MAG: hypothetical protein QOG80_2059, partial [Pseudonocardiales bacterium]|nr:hypothetical protein [Pseudonocardiales bacterium]
DTLAAGSTFEENGEPPYAEDLRSSGLFASVEMRRYPWDQSYPAPEWLQMVLTHSDHVVMAPEVRAAVVDEVTATIEAQGGLVATHYITQAVVATVPG